MKRWHKTSVTVLCMRVIITSRSRFDRPLLPPRGGGSATPCEPVDASNVSRWCIERSMVFRARQFRRRPFVRARQLRLPSSNGAAARVHRYSSEYFQRAAPIACHADCPPALRLTAPAFRGLAYYTPYDPHGNNGDGRCRLLPWSRCGHPWDGVGSCFSVTSSEAPGRWCAGYLSCRGTCWHSTALVIVSEVTRDASEVTMGS
jgi:hypothetical protein